MDGNCFKEGMLVNIFWNVYKRKKVFVERKSKRLERIMGKKLFRCLVGIKRRKKSKTAKFSIRNDLICGWSEGKSQRLMAGREREKIARRIW